MGKERADTKQTTTNSDAVFIYTWDLSILRCFVGKIKEEAVSACNNRRGEPATYRGSYGAFSVPLVGPTVQYHGYSLGGHKIRDARPSR